MRRVAIAPPALWASSVCRYCWLPSLVDPRRLVCRLFILALDLFVNVPIGVIAVLAAARVLERDEPKPHHALDWRGLLMLSPGLAIFVYGLAGLTKIAREGGQSIQALGCVVFGPVLVSAFVLHARRREGALIDVRLFARRAVGAGALTNWLFAAAFFWISIFAAALLPDGTRRIGVPRRVVGGTASLGRDGFHAHWYAHDRQNGTRPRRADQSPHDRDGYARSLTQLQSDTPLWFIECTLFVQGLGMGATMMPSVSAALSTLQHHEIARVTSGVNAMQRVGGSIGITVLTVVLSHEMTKIGATAHATETLSAFDAPCPGQGLWSYLRMGVGNHRIALAVASFLPRKKSTKAQEQVAAAANSMDQAGDDERRLAEIGPPVSTVVGRAGCSTDGRVASPSDSLSTKTTFLPIVGETGHTTLLPTDRRLADPARR